MLISVVLLLVKPELPVIIKMRGLSVTRQNLVASVWVGNDNNENLAGVTGGALPAQIWRSFMEKSRTRLTKPGFQSS